MTNKDLLLQLNSLKNTKADPAWVLANRNILMSQVFSGAEKTDNWAWLKNISLIFRGLAQPAPIATFIALFFMATGVIGWNLSDTAKPGDSIMYPAKLAKERTRITVAFTDLTKAKLNTEFANNRITEINLVNAEPLDKTEKDVKVASLKTNFTNEIKQARERLDKVNAVIAKPVEQQFFSASAVKDDNRVEVSINTNSAKPLITPETPKTINIDPKKSLDEAEKMMLKNDFVGASDKIDEANEILEKIAE